MFGSDGILVLIIELFVSGKCYGCLCKHRANPVSLKVKEILLSDLFDNC